jgi:predicted nucleotidyltransferase
MDKAEALAIVDRFRLALEQRGVRASKIVLFGSFARGNWREDSDIDIAIISPDFEGKDLWQRVKILADEVYELWEPVEAVAFSPAEWERGSSLVAQFAKQGELVYSE